MKIQEISPRRLTNITLSFDTPFRTYKQLDFYAYLQTDTRELS